MKKIALSVAALALTAGSALAADLPSRKGPADAAAAAPAADVDRLLRRSERRLYDGRAATPSPTR